MFTIRKSLFTVVCSIYFIAAYTQSYAPDVLGDGYQFHTIQMPDDYEGKVVCTLVKKASEPETNQAVLYVHGYNDYFFQSQLGDSIVSHGYNFYAVDLRKYGRSLLPHQEPFYCKSLTEYFADIDSALTIIAKEGNTKVFLMGHSTGGLITSLYLNNKKQASVAGLILNSPFLDMNMSWFMERIAIPVVSFLGKFFPNMKVQGYGKASYSHSLLSNHKGEWYFNTDWKMLNSYPKRAGWIRAIHIGQKQVKKGLTISCPVLVLSSDKSSVEKEEWNDRYLSSDIVLDVNDIQTRGAGLGNQVTRDTVPDGIHDLILSPEPARSVAYRIIVDWLKKM